MLFPQHILFYRPIVTEPWNSRHVLFLCECTASSVLEPCTLSSSCWSVVLGSSCTRVLSFGLMSRFGHSRSMFCLLVWVCGLEFARPRALLSTCVLWCCTQLQGQGQGFFICHMINYTGYNQKWNVGQIRSAQWTVQRIKKIKNKIKIKLYKSNTTQEYIYIYIYR